MFCLEMVDFKDYQMIFTFRSDSANTRPGFVIKVEQEECQDNKGSQRPHPAITQRPQLPPPQKPHIQPLPKTHLQPHYKPHFEPHFDIPVAEPPVEEPFIYPPHHPLDYEHLVDYPIYEGTAVQRNLQVSYI